MVEAFRMVLLMLREGAVCQRVQIQKRRVREVETAGPAGPVLCLKVAKRPGAQSWLHRPGASIGDATGETFTHV
jgi:hypothetical protein